MKSVAKALLTIALAMLSGCSSATVAAPITKRVLVSETTAGTKNIELFTDTRLETGLVPLYLKVTDSDGNAVSNANVTFTPMMTMANGKSHSCPLIEVPFLDEDDGLFHTAAVFQMASSEMGEWSASVTIESDLDETGTFQKLQVAESGRAQTFAYTDPTTAAVHRYVSSLNFVEAPRVGLNPVVFTLHEMLDMTTFAPVDDAEPSLDPQMPAMGHGSPGSVDPTPTSMGRYAGRLSFSMQGTWETSVTIVSNGIELGAPKFTTTF